jgi:hypothetical protein
MLVYKVLFDTVDNELNIISCDYVDMSGWRFTEDFCIKQFSNIHVFGSDSYCYYVDISSDDTKIRSVDGFSIVFVKLLIGYVRNYVRDKKLEELV